MKILIVTRHFPPGGGGGVQRPLKFASHLPAMGIETHVLAPGMPGSPEDAELELPTQAWIHRVRYVGPRPGRPAERLLAKQGLARADVADAVHPGLRRHRQLRVAVRRTRILGREHVRLDPERGQLARELERSLHAAAARGREVERHEQQLHRG